MNIEPILHKKTFQELTTDELYELLKVRSEVFVVEQNCVYQDMDGDDQKSIHLWLTVADKIVALARVCPAGTHMKEISIGRVITTERGKGYGKPSYPDSHGIFSSIMEFCFSHDTNIRIDTHRDNKIMQHNILKHGFTYCGIIYLLSGDERLAYQKVVNR